MTIPVPAIPSPRMVALRWLAALLPDLQAGKSLLTPVESWNDDVFATVSFIRSEINHYVPVHDAMIQFDIWGRPSPDGQYRGVPLNRCDAIAEFLIDQTIHFNPLLIDMAATNYADVHLSDAYATDMNSAVAERPPGALVALGRARLTVCFVYKIPN
jgi:hypothetical protein